MFPTLVLPIVLIRVEKFIHRYIQKGDDFVESIKTGVLASILNIHDGAWSKVYKLGQMLLRPAFGLTLAFYFFTKCVAIQAFFILVYCYITPTLFYISGIDIGTKRNFMF